MKPILNKILFPSLFFLIACGTKTENGNKETPPVTKNNDSISFSLVYQGLFPCKDCGGIQTTLRLSNDNHFVLEEEYLKSTTEPFIMKGTFNTERGFEKDADATLYILNDTLLPSDQIFFVRETGKDLLLFKLGHDRKKLNDSVFVLWKMPAK